MIISIMMNYIATLFMGVLFTNWLRDGSVPQTIAVPDGTRLTRLFGLRATSAFIIAIAVGLIVYYFLFNTSKGFRLRAVGFNMTAAKFNGFAVEKYFLFSFLISGMIAGLGGSAEILGTQFFLINGYAAGYGFDGVSMALIGQLHPIATMLVAIFFAALRVGSTVFPCAKTKGSVPTKKPMMNTVRNTITLWGEVFFPQRNERRLIRTVHVPSIGCIRPFFISPSLNFGLILEHFVQLLTVLFT